MCVYMYVCMSYIHVCVCELHHVCVYTCMCVYMYVRIHVCVYMYVCIHVCVYELHTCIHV